MPCVDVVKSSTIIRSARVLQLEGLFDVPPSRHSTEHWSANLPIEDRPWAIGAIVGPSGAGKSTIAREVFGPNVVQEFPWSTEHSILDGFPKRMSMKEITAILSSVGFSSPPAWLRPFAVLSTGQQFRVTLARALAEAEDIAVIDEFTSVIDRTVAQIGSAAVAKSIRRWHKRFVAVSCHYDILDWLQPDWIFEPHLSRFQWRELQSRPTIPLVVSRCHTEAWRLFRGHHYLSADLHPAARVFVATWQDTPVVLTAVMNSAGFVGKWREHRTVCLPDFQGIGIGNLMSDTVAAIVIAATGGEYRSVTSHPSFVRARERSPSWRLTVQPSFSTLTGSRKQRFLTVGNRKRLAATFQYIGPPYPDAQRAKALWLESFRKAA